MPLSCLALSTDAGSRMPTSVLFPDPRSHSSSRGQVPDPKEMTDRSPALRRSIGRSGAGRAGPRVWFQSARSEGIFRDPACHIDRDAQLRGRSCQQVFKEDEVICLCIHDGVRQNAASIPVGCAALVPVRLPHHGTQRNPGCGHLPGGQRRHTIAVRSSWMSRFDRE